MGIAAYNRGSACMSRQLDTDPQKLSILAMIDSLNSVGKQASACKPFGPIHFEEGHGGWWAECPVTGAGYWYPTIRSAVSSWLVTITEARIEGDRVTYIGEI